MNVLYYQVQNVIKGILNKMEIVRTEQLTNALKNYCNLPSEHDAESLIQKFQSEGHVLLSADGWCLKRTVYPTVTGDEKYEKIDFGAKERIQFPINEQVSAVHKSLIDCFWVISELLPFSENFVPCAEPWALSFAAKVNIDGSESDHGFYYKLAKIDSLENGNDIISQVALLSDCINASNAFFRDVTRYVAVIDDEKTASFIPKGIFNDVCILSFSKSRKYRVLPDEYVGTFYEED